VTLRQRQRGRSVSGREGDKTGTKKRGAGEGKRIVKKQRLSERLANDINRKPHKD